MAGPGIDQKAGAASLLSAGPNQYCARTARPQSSASSRQAPLSPGFQSETLTARGLVGSGESHVTLSQ